MKIALTVVSILLILVGAVWFLQGINLLPGSYMTGDIRWSINGGIVFLIGVGLLLYLYDRRRISGGK